MNSTLDASGKFDSYGFLFSFLEESFIILIDSYFDVLKSLKYKKNFYNENKFRDDIVRIAEQKPKSYPFHWDTESRNLSNNSRIDITLIYDLSGDFEKRIGIECKIVGDKNVGNYIDGNGIISFINGKYCSQIPFAGMVAFIEDGITKDIIEQINSKLSQHTTIKTNQSVNFHQIVHNFNYSYKSNHNRFNNLPIIDIYHLLFDYSGLIED